MARATGLPARRCLIVERHSWETGGGEQQLQFLLQPARVFFGSGAADRIIQVRFFLPANAPMPMMTLDVTISREYSNGTRRTNRFPQMGAIPSAFVFFEETDQRGAYDFWWQEDKAIIAARYQGWLQGLNTRYGRGRLSIIVPAPVPRPIDSLG